MCPTPGCGKPIRTKGLCNACYEYKRIHGTTWRWSHQWGRRTDPEIRFWRFVDRRGPDECWPWLGSLNGHGRYGLFSIEPGRKVPAHRYVYELLIGSIPKGYQIDHVKARGCKINHCVNPAHLEAVTPMENMRRAKVLRTRCRRGHLFEGNEIIRKNGTRTCRTCTNERIREWKRQRKAA
jgi:hypothetical protein